MNAVVLFIAVAAVVVSLELHHRRAIAMPHLPMGADAVPGWSGRDLQRVRAECAAAERHAGTESGMGATSPTGSRAVAASIRVRPL